MSQIPRSEIGEFLRSRRAALRPGDVGLPEVQGSLRRVPGLRREEVAIAAGVSVDHYQRVEQGRVTPSSSVVRAIGAVLRLTDDELAHLAHLARVGSGPTGQVVGPRRTEVSPPHLRHLVDALGLPAYVLNARRDVLAWNREAAALFVDFAALPRECRNLAWLVFTDSRLRELYADWHDTARRVAGVLRWAEGEHPDDDELRALLRRLEAASPDFRSIRALREVARKCWGTKVLRHPVVGQLELIYQDFAVTGHPGLELVLFVPQDEPTAERLRVLGSWSAAPST
ncbi:helix-turn-helix domain-containing protein [Quadrisphaera granulorum]|uniref:helix-turn-helix domain-containing protein n=1 Tax=Quadrisphaera granulorum TaxID=317664 RepID=UPI000D6D1F83|nr:helix-turn-helix transcriptional regulator [Quadrisphaera granulorum]